MRMRALAALVVALCVAAGCAQTPAKEGDTEQPELTPEIKSLVLDQAPTDIPHPLYIDFNGRVELLGYALEPQATAAPGSKLSLKLYWRGVAKLDEGYLPYTQLVTPDGRRIDVDGSGPLRKGPLVPSRWQPSKVYIDELDVNVPGDIDAARFSIVVGLRTQPTAPEQPAEDVDLKNAHKKAEKPDEAKLGAVYLSVISGPADSKHGGVITSLETGATPGAQRARAAKDGKRAPGAVKRLPGAMPVSAKPLRPAEPPQ
jgi:hypothetical protein